jgi:beta-xylosidase
VYVRAHSLLVTGDGKPALKWGSTNAYTEDANGNPVYDWRITDSIFDTYIKLGMKPLAQIGFMPEALSTNPQPYNITGNRVISTAIFSQAGHIHQRIIKNGRRSCMPGLIIVLIVMEKRSRKLVLGIME